jgi:hypothetical protein
MGALGHMGFEDEPLPRRVEHLYDEGVFALGVAAGVKHTLVAGADGAVWGFGCLNSIGAWNDPTVKAMRGAGDFMSDGVGGPFGGPEYGVQNGHEDAHDHFDFLYPGGRASTSKPVRGPVDVRGAVLHQGVASALSVAAPV